MMLASSGEKPDPMKFDADLAMFTLIIFIGLLIVLTKYAWKPLMEGLTQRETSIADKISSAEQANEQAQANLRQYEQKLASVNDEANEILAEAKQDGIAAKEKIIAEAQAEAQRQREKALADINAARNQAVRELAEKSVDSAVSLAGNIVGRSLDKSDHSRLIEDSIKRFTREPRLRAIAEVKLWKKFNTQTVFDTNQQQLGRHLRQSIVGVRLKIGQCRPARRRAGCASGRDQSNCRNSKPHLSRRESHAAKKAELIDKVFGGKVSKDLVNFLKILGNKDRFDCLDDVGLCPENA